jgi:uncharacterized protein (DUF58 family)
LPLTWFGKRFLALACILASSSLLFKDLALAVAASITATLLGIEWVSLKVVRPEVKLEVNGISLRMVAGEVKELKVGFNSNLRLKFQPPFSWCSISQSGIHEGTLTFNFSPKLAGEYSSDELPSACQGKLGLIEAYRRHPFQIEVKVYPRVLTAIVRAVEFLLKAGLKGVGDQPIEARGKGLEYAETREYLPGDSLRYIDHKASARLGRLMVKEFYAEAGLMAHLIYDVRAMGPISKDELASAFLNSALGLAVSGAPFGLTIHDGEKLILHLRPTDPSTALKTALSYTISLIEVEPEDLDALLEPRTSSQAKALLIKLKALKPFLEASMERLEEPYKAVERLAEEAQSPINALAILGLMGKLTPLIELSKALARGMGELKLISPCKPWLEAGSLEEAYRLYERWLRAKKLLESAGVKIEMANESSQRSMAILKEETHIAHTRF